MCRHVAYWGPPRPIAELALDAPNSLFQQCTDAREMSWGNDNLDGWGFAWRDDDGRSQRYRSQLSLTGDPDGVDLLSQTKSDRFMVHVRQKTPGSLTDASNSAPFGDGDTTFFSHNGYIEGFRDGAEHALIERLSPERRDGILGDTDSEVLFALVLDRIDAGATPADAVRVIAEVGDEFGGRFNVLLWTGPTMIATRWQNSLYAREDDAVTLTSEPLDDNGWRAVPERSMVIVDDRGARQEAW